MVAITCMASRSVTNTLTCYFNMHLIILKKTILRVTLTNKLNVTVDIKHKTKKVIGKFNVIYLLFMTKNGVNFFLLVLSSFFYNR